MFSPANGLESLSLEEKEDETVYVEKLDENELVEWARYGELGILRELVAQDLHSRFSVTDDRGNTMLHMFSANGHLECVRFILQGCTDAQGLLDRQNFEGNTPLHWACISSQLAVVRLLMLHGAKATVENKIGLTPICEAHKHNRKEILDFFEEFLGSKDQKDPLIDKRPENTN